MSQYHFDPRTYLKMVRDDLPEYDELHGALVAATSPIAARSILDLGMGTGETTLRVLRAHAGAKCVGIDESADMLAAARSLLAGEQVSIVRQRLQEALPDGPFDLVVSALAIHHLDAREKQSLFSRVRTVLRDGGLFVIADVVVPERPIQAPTPLSPEFDKPDTLADQRRWLGQAGFRAELRWSQRDLAVICAHVPGGGDSRRTPR